MLDVGVAVTLEPVDELNVLIGLHTYVVAPVATSEALFPVQSACVGDTTNVGRAVTVTLTVLTLLQPFFTPVIVYVMLADGVATTSLPVVTFKPDDGLQV